MKTPKELGLKLNEGKPKEKCIVCLKRKVTEVGHICEDCILVESERALSINEKQHMLTKKNVDNIKEIIKAIHLRRSWGGQEQ